MRTLSLVACGVLLSASVAEGQRTPSSYVDLERLFTEWRTFEEPPRLDGAPDYRPATNARRLAGLRALQARLMAMDTTGWSVPQQVDWHLVRAEMNGMQYHLTVLKPWARDPAYYASVRTDESDTPAEEGPTIHGAVRLWKYPIWPRTALDTSRALTAAESARLTVALRTVPPLLRQARVNLASANARDLWVGGVRAFEEQSEALTRLKGLVVASRGGASGAAAGAADPALLAAIDSASAATARFTAWLNAEAPKKTGPSGIGKAQYSWFLRSVLLLPLTWDEEVAITRRELARSHASLALEEARNSALPVMTAAASEAEYKALQERALTRYFDWVKASKFVTWEPWMERALRERMMGYSPDSVRNFFSQGNHRDPIPLWTHLWHWWDNGRFREHPHPSVIRRTPLLYNVWMSRAEGMATAMEEWMMHAGLYDGGSPRSREIVWTMLAARAARGLGNLYAHSNQFTMAQAGDLHVNWTPRGWMRRDPLLGFEQHLYLRQPGYGAIYVTGGRLMEETLAERKRQLGAGFTLERFFGEVNGAGMIPVSLIHWELTGDPRMILEAARGLPPGPFR